jgi:hypothetical protein
MRFDLDTAAKRAQVKAERLAEWIAGLSIGDAMQAGVAAEQQLAVATARKDQLVRLSRWLRDPWTKPR